MESLSVPNILVINITIFIDIVIQNLLIKIKGGTERITLKMYGTQGS